MRRGISALVIAAACARKPAAPPPPEAVLTTSDASTIASQLVASFERQTSRKLVVRIASPQQIQSAAGAAAIFKESDVPLRSARLRSVIGYVDYDILGPADDPAHVRGARDAQEAYRRIDEHHRKFCSPVDIPGARGLAPPAVACHGTAADVIATAARLGAYTILDRTSSNATRMPRHYKVLLRDVPPLHAAYVAALLGGPVHHDAEWFVEWLMSYRGREAVESLQIRTEH